MLKSKEWVVWMGHVQRYIRDNLMMLLCLYYICIHETQVIEQLVVHETLRSYAWVSSITNMRSVIVHG